MLHDVFQYDNEIACAISDPINKRVIYNDIRESTSNNMHINNNLLVNTWTYLKASLVANTKSLFKIF